MTDVSEVLTASIMRAIIASEMSVSIYHTTRRNFPEDIFENEVVQV
jgi:hypothetical protein